jgi:pimeloyl-ACP methyl ester carboxylesterase
MAELRPGKVAGVVLLSSFLGEAGPAARWLVDAGARMLSLIPRDLRNAVLEVSNQSAQLGHMRKALERMSIPVHVLHGDRDDFAPIELAQQLAKDTRSRRPIRFESVPGADHFMTDGPAEALIAVLESCIPAKTPAWRLPSLPKLAWPTPRPLKGGVAAA